MNGAGRGPEASVPRRGESVQLSLQPRWTQDYPAADVQVGVRLFWEPLSLNIRFDVEEPQTRALEDNPALVHRDSCVEFFFQPPASDEYMNLEINPVGRCLFAAGGGREGRRDLSSGPGQLITVTGTHVGEPGFNRPCAPWHITAGIPPQAAGLTEWGPHLEGIRMNLYKCGDALDAPHYLSWLPLSSEKPDFHRPTDFGRLRFS